MLMRVATVTDTEDYRVKVRHGSFHHLCDVIERRRPRRPPPGGVVPTHGSPAGTAPRSDGPPRDGRLSGVCPTAGCRGVGHIKGAKYTGHHSAFGCPYSDINMRKEVVLPDRLGGERSVTLVPVSIHQQAYLPHSLQAALHQSVFLSAMSPQPGRDLSLCWEQHRKLLPGVARIPADAVQCWSVQQVSDFIESLPGCEEQAQQFREEVRRPMSCLDLMTSAVTRWISSLLLTSTGIQWGGNLLQNPTRIRVDQIMAAMTVNDE
uniref:Uncharacterized protein n=1 Tax=Cyprinodon variegatus TaxID=28743 RepID=A0A3Q2CBD5_CYPVA